MRRAWALVACATAACGYITGSSADASLNVAFHGIAPTLPPVIVELQTITEHRSHLWIGGPSATTTSPQVFAPVALQGGDSLTAVAILRNQQGVELVRAATGIRLQSHWLYGVDFQAGGLNPDVAGACHHPPQKVEIPGSPGDTLYVWITALPEGAVC